MGRITDTMSPRNGRKKMQRAEHARRDLWEKEQKRRAMRRAMRYVARMGKTH